MDNVTLADSLRRVESLQLSILSTEKSFDRKIAVE